MSSVVTSSSESTGMHEVDLCQLIWQSMSIRERINSLADSAHESSTLPSAALDRWRSELGLNDETLFRERLQWLCEDRHIDLDSALADVPPVKFKPPAWSRMLQPLVNMTCRGYADSPAGFPSKSATEVREDLPFAPLFRGAIQVARRELTRRLERRRLSVETSLQNWAEAAWHAVETALLQSLIGICTKSLNELFQADLPFGRRALLKLGIDTPPTGARYRYYRFVAEETASGLRRLFESCPVLARLICIRIDHWSTATAEFLERLHGDRPRLATFRSDEESGNTRLTDDAGLQVVGVMTGLSDPHQAGRTVAIVEFKNGRKVVYKPRSLQMDAGFQELLGWVNRIDSQLSFRTLTVLDRGDYGWCEFVAAEDCASTGEVETFYQRAGALTAIFYALNTTDLHHENLIAARDQPVAIDLETLLAPRRYRDEFQGTSELENPAGDSILQTGLFPQWAVSRSDLMTFDVGGWTGGDQPATLPTAKQWCHINTDDMALMPREVRIEASRNVPRIDGERQPVWDHLDCFRIGFLQMYSVLREHRAELLAPEGPLRSFFTGEVRVILRDTQVYASLLDECLDPRCLKSGVAWSMKLESLLRPLLKSDERRAWGRFADQEIAALDQLDIPRLTTTCDGEFRGGVLDGLPQPACIEQAHDRIRLLDDGRDLNLQTSLIGELLSSRSGRDVPTPSISLPAPSSCGSDNDSLFVAEAQSLGELILRHSIRDRSGDLFWLGGVAASRNTHEGRLEFGVNDLALYEGRAGTALFFAALFHATGDRRHAIAARETLRPLVDRLKCPEGRKRLVQELPLGGTLGIGSLVYCLCRCGEFLGLQDLINAAERLTSEIPKAQIANDKDLDLMKGAAGLVASLVTASQVSGRTLFLDRAVEAGERLLSSRTVTSSGRRAWQIPTEDRPLTGFSHGASGIAHALLELSEASGRSRFRDAATEAIEFENEHFISEAGNWADLRKLNGKESRDQRTLTMWCNGAVGIGLSRVHAGRLCAAPASWHEDTERAIATGSNESASPLDHCCCGQFGRIELLISAASVLQQPERLEAARTLAASTLNRAADGGYRISTGDAVRAAVSPAFFTGLAGIGYQLLRLSDPDRFPSVLALQ